MQEAPSGLNVKRKNPGQSSAKGRGMCVCELGVIISREITSLGYSMIIRNYSEIIRK